MKTVQIQQLIAVLSTFTLLIIFALRYHDLYPGLATVPSPASTSKPIADLAKPSPKDDSVYQGFNITKEASKQHTLHKRAGPLSIFTLEPITQAYYQELVCKGAKLMYEMDQKTPSIVEQSRFVTTCDPLMESYGWRKSGGPVLNLKHLSTALGALGIAAPINQPRQQNGRFGDWIDLRWWTHAARSLDPDTGQWKEPANQPAMGPNMPDYKAYSVITMNARAGLIVASQRYTPKLIPAERNPSLKQASDIAFLNWYHNALVGSNPGGTAPVPAPRHAICVTITNPETMATIKHIWMRDNLQFQDWPGHVFETSTDDGKALLATPNVKGFAWMFLQHKRQFGEHRTVKSVRVWFPPYSGRQEYRYPNLYVEFAERIQQGV